MTGSLQDVGWNLFLNSFTGHDDWEAGRALMVSGEIGWWLDLWWIDVTSAFSDTMLFFEWWKLISNLRE